MNISIYSILGQARFRSWRYFSPLWKGYSSPVGIDWIHG